LNKMGFNIKNEAEKLANKYMYMEKY